MTLLNINLRQYYFSFLGRIYQPDEGVAMGSPIPGTIAEVFLQQLENSIIRHLIDAKILSFYTRYVDDIFLIYDSTRTNPDYILQYIDTTHSNIQLSPTMESNNNVNFLDLSITRRPTCLGISILRKPTSTDTTINFLSNHPLEHKMAAYRFFISRMLSLPLDKEQQDKDWQHILHIAHNNGIPLTLLTKLRLRIQRNNSLPKSPTPPPHLPPPIRALNGQPSHTRHHRSGKLPASSNTPT